MATCRDPEGWNAVSRLRDFDTTPCFEEGIILSSLTALLLVTAVLRSFALSWSQPRERSSKSWWVLRIKLVREYTALVAIEFTTPTGTYLRVSCRQHH